MFRRPAVELEAPPTSHMLCGAICSILCFFSLPFLLLMISEGFFDNYFVLSWFEIGFHLLIFLIIYFLFREFLQDSLLNMQLNRAEFIKTVATAAGWMLAVGLVWFVLYRYTGNNLLVVAAYGTFPLTELDALILGADSVTANPIFATACMVLVTPVITGCLYYAIGFAFFYNIRPWLGWITVCLAVAFPRICCGSTWWVPEQQWMLYIAQLPMHLIACWAYKKMDTVWAPIGALAAVNLISSVLMNLFL